MTGRFVHGNIGSRNMALNFHNVSLVDTIRYATRANAELYKKTDVVFDAFGLRLHAKWENKRFVFALSLV